MGLGATAQTDIVYVWNKWCERKDTMLLFNAANNAIQVYCPTLKPAQIMLKSLDKTLRIGRPEIKGDTITVLAMPYPAPGKPMRLAVLNAKTKKPIRTVEFTSDNVPAPMARMGKIKTQDAPKKEIQSQTQMNVFFPNSLYSYPYKISQYTFKIHHEKGAATIPVNGCLLTRPILEQTYAAPVGTTFEFTGIKATCPECVTKLLDDVKVKIK